MVRIVIVDDDKDFAQKVKKLIQKYFKELRETVSVKQHGEGSTLLDELAANRNYDIYFLDVEMPGINGLDLARKIKSSEKDADIVFISAHEKYAIPSYKVRACYYILKEEYEDEVPTILKQIWQERADKGADYYAIQSALYGKRIRLDDIIYLMREKKYVVFHCADKTEYRERGTLGEIYSKLPHDKFVYIDRGYIVNLRHVSDWGGDVIQLDSGIALAASRRMLRQFKDALAMYWKEG